MTVTIQETLGNLMPKERLCVMDLVEQAGIDVRPWYTKANGKPVKNPKANPSFCFDWAFGSEKEGFLVCIWHRSLEVFDLPSGQAIGYNENFREPALELDRKAIDRTQPGDKRHGMRRQARACTFKRALQLSFHRAMPVRVIVVEGVQDERAELGKESARVKVRKLDTENWFMHAYDNDSGNTLLVRGIPLPSTQNVTTEVEAEVSVATVPESAGPMYVDQFSAPVTASIQEATVLVRERSAVVREAVLRRAGGVCELCN
jgi:hypothetical protein